MRNDLVGLKRVEKKLNYFIRALLVIWELPQSILAGIIFIFIKKRITDRQAFKEAIILYVKNFPGGIPLGRLIILNDKYYNNYISKKHEYGHSIQSMILGWSYLLVVGLPSIIRALIWKVRKLDSKDYYLRYPEDWANRLGFQNKENINIEKKLK
jgi:hypothetical protein